MMRKVFEMFSVYTYDWKEIIVSLNHYAKEGWTPLGTISPGDGDNAGKVEMLFYKEEGGD